LLYKFKLQAVGGSPGMRYINARFLSGVSVPSAGSSQSHWTPDGSVACDVSSKLCLPRSRRRFHCISSYFRSTGTYRQSSHRSLHV